MNRYFPLFLRGIRHIFRKIGDGRDWLRLHYMLYINGVEYKSIHSHGMPYFCVGVSGKCSIGKDFCMNNGLRFNPIGYPQPCIIYVGEHARLSIGNHVGMSQASVICHKEIEIQDYVKIGGGVRIYDTDFHSIDHLDRRHFTQDMASKQMAKVTIEHDAFVGAGVTILKGVTIGACAVIGAGSVVTKDVPPCEIWGGNPARFIRKI